MITVLATASGGPSTLSFTRSLRDADPAGSKYRLIGTDCDPHNIHRSEVDETYLCPKASSTDYIPFLLKLINKERVDVLHSQPEIEAYTIGKNREQIIQTGCRLFMPAQSTIECLRDKWASYRIWSAAGIKVPKNIFLNTEADLEQAFTTFGKDIWIRETVGAAGKGSLSRPTFETAKTHLDESRAWGHAVAAEHLGRDTVTWQSIWNNGRLVVGQGRKRHSWAFGNRAQSGVTGLTGVGETVSDPQLDELAIACIKATDPNPNGIFSVDFTYDLAGVPNPTEINIAKFFTTHHFLTRTGCNMPEILVQLAMGTYQGAYDLRNPCTPAMLWIRGIDVNPVLISKDAVETKLRHYEDLCKESL